MDVLIGKSKIHNRVKEMARQLEEHTAKYDNELPPVFICVLNGAYKFFTDLVSEYHGVCEIDFVRAKSYNGKDNSGGVEIKKDVEVGLLGKNVYIIDDIIDSGNTMNALIEHFGKQNPNKISVISLLKRKENPYPVDPIRPEVMPRPGMPTSKVTPRPGMFRPEVTPRPGPQPFLGTLLPTGQQQSGLTYSDDEKIRPPSIQLSRKHGGALTQTVLNVLRNLS